MSLFKDIIGFFRRSNDNPLRAKKVRFSYDDKDILRGLNLSVKSSQILAVVGKSGSGKTTFLNIVSGVLAAKFQGKISIFGLDRSLSKEDIGYVPQEMAIIPDLSIEENFRFFGRINGLDSDKAVEKGVQLMDLLQLEIPKDRYPGTLSGGQKMRLNIIASILHDPKILILDEPFVGLDYYNRKLLWHFLEHQKNRHRTVILTTHMLTEAEHHAQRIVLLHEGKIFARGKVDDIRRKLKTRFIVEVKFSYISKTNTDRLSKYCKGHDITIMDHFNNYMMFSITGEGQRNYLFRFLDKLKLDYQEIGFRKPNLDELFLKVRAR